MFAVQKIDFRLVSIFERNSSHLTARCLARSQYERRKTKKKMTLTLKINVHNTFYEYDFSD